MWLRDIKNYEVEIYKDEQLIYSGNIDDLPENMKGYETKTMNLVHKKIIIELV